MYSVHPSLKVKEIITFLLTGQKTLSQLSEELAISKPATLRYMNELESAGMVSSEVHNTVKGRERVFSAHAFSMVFSVDPEKGLISFEENASLDSSFPLVGQIEQEEFRKAVMVYMKEISSVLENISLVVFGSVARGEATRKSDIDLLVLKKNKWTRNEEEEIMGAVYEGSVKAVIQVKPVFWTIDDLAKKEDALAQTIKKEGVIVHDTHGDELLWAEMKRYWNIIG